jgi:hypothetical protein
MRTVILLCFACVLAAGCVSRPKARRIKQAAFLAGQQQALAAAAAQTPTSPNIQVVGEVQNSIVEWRDGLSLAQAIVDAGYLGERDPLQIVIFRRGQVITVSTKDLLRGYDHALEPGDKIEIQR